MCELGFAISYTISIYISSNKSMLVLSISEVLLVLCEFVAPTIILIKNNPEFYSFQYILFFSTYLFSTTFKQMSLKLSVKHLQFHDFSCLTQCVRNLMRACMRRT